MTKRELISALEPFNDDEVVHLDVLKPWLERITKPVRRVGRDANGRLVIE